MFVAVVAAFSALAEDFNIARFNDLAKNQPTSLGKYCYEANISQESNSLQCSWAIRYWVKNINQKPTKQQINEFVGKYNLKGAEANKALALAYARAGFVKQAMNLYNGSEKLYINFLVKYSAKADLWLVALKVLTVNGGFNDSKVATSLIERAFRYKPATVTKQDQIKFIEQLAQIYPIPGTDFNKWKGFMGFIGYKYKALTGKDLFPESK